MASQSKPLTLCELCERVYDPNGDVWMRLTEYHASYSQPADSYAFTATFCNACHPLYSAMIGTRKEPHLVDGSISGVLATSVPESTHILHYGYA